MVEYSIPICNYNMAETLRESVESVHEQIDSRFEILLIDDGSSDKSPAVMEQLSDEYEQVRHRLLEPDPGRELGQTRNISVEESRGEHIILQMDADDIALDSVIPDFTSLYHQVEAQFGKELLLVGKGFQMANKDYLFELGPYRNLAVGGEDLGLWRRCLAEGTLIWLDSEPLCESIGYEPDTGDTIRRTFGIEVSDFQCGLSFWSYARWILQTNGPKGIAFNLFTLPIAFALAQTRPQYDCPPEFRRKGTRHHTMEEQKLTLSEIERRYDIDVDRSAFSQDSKLF